MRYGNYFGYGWNILHYVWGESGSGNDGLESTSKANYSWTNGAMKSTEKKKSVSWYTHFFLLVSHKICNSQSIPYENKNLHSFIFLKNIFKSKNVL